MITGIHSVSELYDNIIWSTATSRLGLSTTGSSIYTDSIYEVEDADEEEENPAEDDKNKASPDLDEDHPMYLMGTDDSWAANESNDRLGKKILNDDGSGKSAFVLFYLVNACVQYKVSTSRLLHLNLVCLYLISFAN